MYYYVSTYINLHVLGKYYKDPQKTCGEHKPFPTTSDTNSYATDKGAIAYNMSYM